MKGFCPNCEIVNELEFVELKEEIKIRGETINVQSKKLKCLECENTFDDPKAGEDSLDKAYREYRLRQGMLQPEEIREFRRKYGLTQLELSKLLGWGIVTLSRYENGALQDEAHERSLRLIMEPSNLLHLLGTASNLGIWEDKKKRLIAELEAFLEESHSFERICEERFSKYELDELSGFQKFNISKLFNSILFFCRDGLTKTKLNKLLFYSDFKHFKEYTLSITGVRYARLPFGPVPDNYDYYFATLIHEEKAIRVDEVIYSENASGEVFYSERMPDLSIFSDSELKILASIKEHFKDFSAKMISDFSHQERGYKETPTGRLISYDYAQYLQV
jgi:putative zinc finger/helix-turn-helix YgiT family protein